VSSPFLRTKETVEIVADACGGFPQAGHRPLQLRGGQRDPVRGRLSCGEPVHPVQSPAGDVRCRSKPLNQMFPAGLCVRLAHVPQRFGDDFHAETAGPETTQCLATQVSVDPVFLQVFDIDRSHSRNVAAEEIVTQ